jgi:hypothetical protein
VKGEAVTVQEQRLSALEKGNRVRQSNAALKARLKSRSPIASRRAAIEVITELHEHEGAGRMRVAAFLEGIRHAGPARVNQWLNRAGITPTRRFEELTFRQVQALVTELEASVSKLEGRQ